MAMGQMQLLAGGGRKERAALYEDAKQVGILRRMMESIPEFSYRFLPSNGDDGVPDDYACDEFRIYEFKVRRCSRGRSHDWTDCPYAHPGEKARRRDPRKYNYSGTVCPEFRKGSCRRGDSCEFSHGVFESWLHPTKYRTMACKDGRSCRRKICFFAHTPQQLRVLPPCANSGAGYCPTCSAAKAVAAAAAVHHHHHVPIGGCSPNTPLGVGSMIGYTSPSLSPPSPHSSMAYQAMLNELMTAVDRIDLNSTNVVNPGNCRFSPATPVNNHHHHRSHPTFYSPVPMWKLQEEDEADAITRAELSSRVAGAAEGGGDYNIWGPEFDWVKDLVQI